MFSKIKLESTYSINKGSEMELKTVLCACMCVCVCNDLFAGCVVLATVWIPGSGGGWTWPRINLLVVDFLSHLLLYFMDIY